MTRIKPYYQEKEGRITIYNADCLQVMKEMPSQSFDLIIADAPYGLNYRSNRGAKTGNLKDYIENDKDSNALIFLIQKTIPELIRLLKKDSEIYWFCGGGGGEPVLAYAWFEFMKFQPDLRVKNLLVWDKKFVGMGWDWRFQYETIFQLVKGKGIKNSDLSASNVISAPKIIPQAGEHPTPKSTEIISHILQRKSKPADTILDPFMGSGTTLVAAKQLGRKAVGIEISERYCQIGRQRLSQEVLGF